MISRSAPEPILIVGAGATGLTLACELARLTLFDLPHKTHHTLLVIAGMDMHAGAKPSALSARIDEAAKVYRDWVRVCLALPEGADGALPDDGRVTANRSLPQNYRPIEMTAFTQALLDRRIQPVFFLSVIDNAVWRNAGI